MLLLNKSLTKFKILEDKDPRVAIFSPNTTREIPTELAQKLLRMYPKQIVTVQSLSADLVSGDIAKARIGRKNKKIAAPSQIIPTPALPAATPEVKE